MVRPMRNNVLSYLEDTVRRVPEKTAFSDGSKDYTFARIYGGSRSVGTFLHSKGLFREPVVVFMGKHPIEIIAFLGVVAAGCWYVPVDEEMPLGRIELILQNCNARMILCDKGTCEKAKEFSFQGEICLFDDIADTPENGEVLAAIRNRALDVDPVYVIFTSGSTGIPKGVAACHRSVIDYVEQLSKVLGFGETTVFANQAPLYFDACLKELFPTLKFGATTYLLPKELFLFPVKLVEFLNEHKVNTICWVASVLSMVSSFGTFETARPKYLHTIAFGGEAFSVAQLHIWQDCLPQASFTNLYGPTEGTGMSCYYPVSRPLGEDEMIPIGKPFPNTEILLLDEEGKPAQKGEIYIRGTCVTLGYYNDPERTAASFVQNPLHTLYPELVYRTGDVGRYNEYQELVFVSRKDHQIKHMGHRIELGEVEAAASRAGEVSLCCCIYDAEKSKILLYYTGKVQPGELTVRMKELLPRYMMPNETRRLESMPLTANGKIDRRALMERRKNGRNKGSALGELVLGPLKEE